MSVLERLPATGRIMSYGDYQLLGYKGPEFMWNSPVLATNARIISSEVFEMEREEAASEVTYNMKNGGSIIIATLQSTGEAVAYSTQRILEPTIDGNRIRVMFTTTRAVKKGHDSKGIGPAMLQYAFSTHDAPDIIGGRTGMAPVIDMYYKADLIEEGKFYPYDRYYNESHSMVDVLRYVNAQTKEKRPVNENTGHTPSVYDKDSERLYIPQKASVKVKEYRDRMINEFGVIPARGDALIVLGVKKGWTRFSE